MVKVGGSPADPAVAAHVDYARSLGFNALWAYARETGAEWTVERAPKHPVVSRAFRRFARLRREQGFRLWVSINPVADTDGRFVFSDPAGEERIVGLASLLARAGVLDLVLSFDDQPTALAELSDVLRYGRSAAPAHLDLARRVAVRLPAGMRLWLCAAVYCDAHLGAGDGPYAKPFLEGLADLPPSIGIVWTGPTVISPSITRADLDATRARLGGRELLLYDNYPMQDEAPLAAFSVSLAPLRDREPEIASAVHAYLACPGTPLGASRLTLATIADFLRDPAAYDAQASRDRALARLAGAGASEATRLALDTQQIEWGHFPRDPAGPAATAARLHDPAFVSSFTWTEARYPGRIAALEALADAAFRGDLLRAMRRRLAVARALPLAIEYLARRSAGRQDADVVLARLRNERASWSHHREALAALDTFLSAAGIPAAPARPS
jgi:beta-N-acetylglucosaminidase-like protein